MADGSAMNILRLNQNLQHLPARPLVNDPRCQFHRYAGMNIAKSGAILLCQDCSVHLCIECYSKYHTLHDLSGLKANIEKEAKTSGKKTARPSTISMKNELEN